MISHLVDLVGLVYEIFYKENVKSHHPRDGLLEERAGAADQANVWDLGGTRGIGPDEVDPG